MAINNHYVCNYHHGNKLLLGYLQTISFDTQLLLIYNILCSRIIPAMMISGPTANQPHRLPPSRSSLPHSFVVTTHELHEGPQGNFRSIRLIEPTQQCIKRYLQIHFGLHSRFFQDTLVQKPLISHRIESDHLEESRCEILVIGSQDNRKPRVIRIGHLDLVCL